MTITNSEKIDYFSDEIKNLIRLSQEGDKGALELLIKKNEALINSLVKKYVRNPEIYDDLFQIGCIGFIKAVKNFDFSYDNKFSTYAVYVIDGELRRYFRDENIIKVSRSLKNIYLKSRNFREEYKKKYGIEPSIELTCKEINCSTEELLTAIDACKMPEYLYDNINNSNSKEDGNFTLVDVIEDKKAFDDDYISTIDIKTAITNLEPKDRQVIILRYFQNKTQKEIASLLKISQVQVSRIERRIIDKIRVSLNA